MFVCVRAVSDTCICIHFHSFVLATWWSSMCTLSLFWYSLMPLGSYAHTVGPSIFQSYGLWVLEPEPCSCIGSRKMWTFMLGGQGNTSGYGWSMCSHAYKPFCVYAHTYIAHIHKSIVEQKWGEAIAAPPVCQCRKALGLFHLPSLFPQAQYCYPSEEVISGRTRFQTMGKSHIP